MRILKWKSGLLAYDMTGPWNVPSPASLVQAGQREVAALADLLAATEPGQSVHGARRRIKQLRSLLRLLRPVLGDDSCGTSNAALRDAADALAGHRRAEALVTAAAKLGSGDGQNAFWCDVAEAHRKAHTAEGDPALSLATARLAIARAAAALGSAVPVPSAEDAVGEALVASYGKARKLLRRALDSGDAVRLHEARKFVIHHLHHLRLLEPVSTHRIAELERLRESLGDLNDLDELQQIASGIEINDTAGRCLRKARRRLLREAGKRADRLFRLKPSRLAKRLRHAANPHSPGDGDALQAGE